MRMSFDNIRANSHQAVDDYNTALDVLAAKVAPTLSKDAVGIIGQVFMSLVEIRDKPLLEASICKGMRGAELASRYRLPAFTGQFWMTSLDEYAAFVEAAFKCQILRHVFYCYNVPVLRKDYLLKQAWDCYRYNPSQIAAANAA